MGLLDNEEFSKRLSDLKKDHEAFSSGDIHKEYLTTIGSVTGWKFSTGDYFDRVPYEDERQGYAPPRLLKKNYESFDEARWLGKFSAGFSNDQHVVTIQPEEQGIQSVSANIYKKNSGRLDVWKTKHRWMNNPKKKQESLLLGLGRFEYFPDSMLYVTVGQGDAFAIYLYTYSPEGLLLHTDAYSKGWSQESRWTYHYDEKGELLEIRTGGVVLWPSK